jgi:YdjC-like protein
LGHPPDARLLMIHADNLGMSQAVNRASLEALENGWVTDAAVMVPCPWFPEIARWARQHPDADLGLHLTLNSEWNDLRWGPLSPVDKVASLLADDGYLPKSTSVIREHARPAEVLGSARCCTALPTIDGELPREDADPPATLAGTFPRSCERPTTPESLHGSARTAEQVLMVLRAIARDPRQAMRCSRVVAQDGLHPMQGSLASARNRRQPSMASSSARARPPTMRMAFLVIAPTAEQVSMALREIARDRRQAMFCPPFTAHGRLHPMSAPLASARNRQQPLRGLRYTWPVVGQERNR